MTGVSVGEWLLFGGIGVMAVAAAAGAGCMILFRITGRRLREKLEQEYGKPMSR